MLTTTWRPAWAASATSTWCDHGASMPDASRAPSSVGSTHSGHSPCDRRAGRHLVDVDEPFGVVADERAQEVDVRHSRGSRPRARDEPWPDDSGTVRGAGSPFMWSNRMPSGYGNRRAGHVTAQSVTQV